MGVRLPPPAPSTSRIVHRMASREILSRSLTIVVGAVGIFSVAGLLGRWRWIPDGLSHFVAQYALLTALASIGLLWCRRLGWAAAAAATCAFQVVQLSPYLPSIGSTTVGAPSFKVFQFNVGAKSKHATRFRAGSKPERKSLMSWCCLRSTPSGRTRSPNWPVCSGGGVCPS